MVYQNDWNTFLNKLSNRATTQPLNHWQNIYIYIYVIKSVVWDDGEWDPICTFITYIHVNIILYQKAKKFIQM